MKINIANLGLNDFFLRKSDIIYGLYHALNSLGYDTIVSHNQLNGKSLNVLIGSDIISGDISAINQLMKPGIDYAIYEVENFNGLTINYLNNFSLDNYSKLVEGAKFIITPYAYNLSTLKSKFGDEKIRYAKWGYHHSMRTNNIDRNHDFQFDALFFGLIKGTRHQKYDLLNAVLTDKMRLITEKDPFTIRDYAVSKSRFGLSLSYGETDDFVNPFRLYYMAANEMPILADNTKDLDGYLNICEQVSLDEMIQLIQNKDLSGTHSFEKCVEQNLAANLKEVL